MTMTAIFQMFPIMTLCRRSLPGILFVVALFSATNASGRTLIIEDVVLIDGTGRAPVSQVSVLIEGERIAWITQGKFDEAQRTQARIIEGTRKYLIPGLFDVHVHLAGSVEVTREGLREVENNRDQGVRALQGYLYSGVTSIYESGNIPDYIFALREQERTGKLVSPRIHAAGGIVTYPGSHGGGPGATLVDDWPAAIPLLEEHSMRRPDVLKLTLEERGWGARPLIPILPLPLMQKIIEFYNDRGIRTTAHTASELRARQAIYAGIDSLSHPVITGPITGNFAQLMAVKQIPMATTLTIGDSYSRLAEHPEFLDQPLYRAVLTPEEIMELQTTTREKYQGDTWTWWMKLMTPIAQENIRQIHAAGGIVALGTDQSAGPAVHREMELLVAAGISPLDVIRIATLHGAKFLGRDETLGSITEGKLADLVLLEADPIEDINNTKRVNTVIKNGVIIARDKLNLPVNQRGAQD
jgi:imidazolonepropionase-like amidohydrolase